LINQFQDFVPQTLEHGQSPILDVLIQLEFLSLIAPAAPNTQEAPVWAKTPRLIKHAGRFLGMCTWGVAEWECAIGFYTQYTKQC